VNEKKEYIERGALIAFVREVRKRLPKDSKDFFTRDEMLLNFQQYLELQKAADVEPVVRCKDCVKWGMRDCKRNPCAIDISSMDEFCSDGERKAHMDERSDA